MHQKTFTIVAGPNGAGKTTFVENTFPAEVANNKFVNADHFARNLNPQDVSKVAIQAGKDFLRELDLLTSLEESFITETTLSGKTLLKKIQVAQGNGFHVKLIFLSLSSASLCDFRVKARVASGGHNIQLNDIKRRYHRGLLNLETYKESIDSFELYNADNQPSLIISQQKNELEIIHDQVLYEKFQNAIQSISSS